MKIDQYHREFRPRRTMSQDSETQTESTNKYNAFSACHALIQASPEEKSCYREFVQVDESVKIITPLFWREMPKNIRFKSGKSLQTPRNFFMVHKYTEFEESDFKNPRSAVIESTGKTSIQVKRKSSPPNEVQEFKKPRIVGDVLIKKPLALVDKPNFPVPNIFPEPTYVPTPILILEKAKLENKVKNLELELEKLTVDQEVNKIAMESLSQDMHSMDKDIGLAIDRSLEVEREKDAQEIAEIVESSFEKMEVDVDYYKNPMELDDQSIKNWWPGGL